MKTSTTMILAGAIALALAGCADDRDGMATDADALTADDRAADGTYGTDTTATPGEAPALGARDGIAAAAGDATAYATDDGAADDSMLPAVADEGDALGVLLAIDEHEVAASQMALDAGLDGPAAEFARKMVAEHGANRDRTRALMPDGTAPAARRQAEKGEAAREALRGQSGDALRRAYVHQMVVDHTEALVALDQRLIPAATAPAVLEHLRTTREHVEAHLKTAQQLEPGTDSPVAASAAPDAADDAAQR